MSDLQRSAWALNALNNPRLSQAGRIRLVKHSNRLKQRGNFNASQRWSRAWRGRLKRRRPGYSTYYKGRRRRRGYGFVDRNYGDVFMDSRRWLYRNPSDRRHRSASGWRKHYSKRN